MGTPTTPSGHRQPRGASEPLYSQMVRLYLRLFITLQGFFFFLSLFILFFPGTNKLFNAMALIISRCQCAGATLAVLGKPQPFSVGCAAPPFSGDVSFFTVMRPAGDSKSWEPLRTQSSAGCVEFPQAALPLRTWLWSRRSRHTRASEMPRQGGALPGEGGLLLPAWESLKLYLHCRVKGIRGSLGICTH